MLKLPTMPMDIFKKVLGNIDEKYPFTMSPKLILALLVLTGLCTIIIGILFIWYKRKTSFTSSTMGNLLKLIPSLKEKIPTLDSLLPIYQNKHNHKILKMLLLLLLFLNNCNLHQINLYYHCIGTKTTYDQTTTCCSLSCHSYGNIAFHFNCNRLQIRTTIIGNVQPCCYRPE